MVFCPSDFLRHGQNAVGFANDSLAVLLLDTLAVALLVVEIDGEVFGVVEQLAKPGFLHHQGRRVKNVASGATTSSSDRGSGYINQDLPNFVDHRWNQMGNFP